MCEAPASLAPTTAEEDGSRPMRILIINPNSDPGMTAAIQESAEAFAEDAFEVVTMSTPGAPHFIETYAV